MIKKPDVLILSSIYDFSSDLIALRLKQRRIRYLRLNKEHFKDYRITIDPEVKIMKVKVQDESFLLSNPKSIFFRQPVFLRNSPSRALSIQEQLARTQWSAFLRSLSIFDNSKWINWPQATYLAESKPYQLSIAKRCGLKIPKTLVGNDAIEINNVFPEKKLVKSMDTVFLRERDECLFTYSTLLEGECLSEENSSEVPFIAQEYIDDKVDCRVTIIGERVFSVYILKNGKPIAGDWRTIAKKELQYKTFQIPETLKDSCLQLMRRLNLSFGAIDLLKTGSDYLFLEVNPTGEWGWLCNEERKIDHAIVEELIT